MIVDATADLQGRRSETGLATPMSSRGYPCRECILLPLRELIEVFSARVNPAVAA